MLTKKVWPLVFFSALALLSLRIFTYFEDKQTSGPITVSGQVLSEPYLKRGQLNFRLERYFVTSPYQNIGYGEVVEVKGELKDGRLVAEKITVLPRQGFEGWLSEIRFNLNDQIAENLPSPQSDLLSGVVLGIKSNLDREFKEKLVNTGTLHVVVVSGYNIALVASLALTSSFLIGRKKASLLAALLILGYTFLVGASPPTLRASLMGVLTIVAVLLGRQAIAAYLLILTAYFLLLINPENLVDISFQLTFMATLGLIVFTKPISNLLNKLINPIREPLATTLAAQVLVVPLIFFYFGNISLAAPLVNLLVLWTVPISTVLGFVYLPLLQANSFLAGLVGFLLIIPLTIFVQIVEFFGQFKLLVYQGEKGNWLFLVGYCLLLSGFLLMILKAAYARKTTQTKS